jgi:hypothetical protein
MYKGDTPAPAPKVKRGSGRLTLSRRKFSPVMTAIKVTAKTIIVLTRIVPAPKSARKIEQANILLHKRKPSSF